MQLSYVSVVTKQLDEMKDFYVQMLGIEELTDWSHDGFRALEVAPNVILALHTPEAFRELGLELGEDDLLATMLTFDPGSVDELHRIHDVLVAANVPVVREPFETPYGSLQVIHRDPDGNPFRLNTFVV